MAGGKSTGDRVERVDLPVAPTEAEDRSTGRKKLRDQVCVDERSDDRDRDGAELQGSMLEVGAAMAGLTPVETPLPDTEDRNRGEGGSGCGNGC